MARIGITQRVEVVEAYEERRDCLDQRWTGLVDSNGHTPLPLPNTIEVVADYLDETAIDGLVLTGGNDLAHIDDAEGAAPERDRFETAALEYALDVDLPVMATCRGMQLLNVYYGGSVTHVEEHVAMDHTVTSAGVSSFLPPGDVTVNSYHDYGIRRDGVASPLEVLASASDETIECVRVPDRPVIGVMWHPERDSPASDIDRRIFEHLFGRADR